MKSICMTVLPFLASVGMLSAVGAHHATAQETKAVFTIDIAAKDENPKTGQVGPLIVKEKNVSAHEIDLGRTMDQNTWYRIEIRRNGGPVPKTEEMRRREARQKTADSMASPFFLTLKPGEEAQFDLPISSFYEMTEPGVYEITLAREADPEHSGRTVTVKSNTISITVLPADDPPSKNP